VPWHTSLGDSDIIAHLLGYISKRKGTAYISFTQVKNAFSWGYCPLNFPEYPTMVKSFS
jgi:hypothetical protein